MNDLKEKYIDIILKTCLKLDSNQPLLYNIPKIVKDCKRRDKKIIKLFTNSYLYFFLMIMKDTSGRWIPDNAYKCLSIR